MGFLIGGKLVNQISLSINIEHTSWLQLADQNKRQERDDLKMELINYQEEYRGSIKKDWVGN